MPRVAIALLALACVAGGTASAVSGRVARLSDSDATKPRLTVRINGQGVVVVGAVRLRCVSQAASNVVCKDTVAFGRQRTVTVRERPRSGWRFVRWSGRAAERIRLASSTSSVSRHSRQSSAAPKQGRHE